MSDADGGQGDRVRSEQRAARARWLAANVDRELAALDDVVARVDAPVGWVAVRRQAVSYRRHVDGWLGMLADQWYGDLTSSLAGYRRRIDRYIELANERLDGLDADQRRSAEETTGLRVAVIGKGGAGKSFVASTLARLLALRGRPVLAVDLDTSPGLAWSIGLGSVDVGLPDDAVERCVASSYGWQLRSDLLPRQAVERFGIVGPEGVTVTGIRKIAAADKDGPKRTVVAVRQVLAGFAEPGWDIVADLEAGPTTPFENYHGFADHVVIVVGPSWRSALTARRLRPMIGEGQFTTVVANRFRDEPDHPGLTPEVRLPLDAAVSEAERQGVAPLDACADSPTVTAIGALADRLLKTLRTQPERHSEVMT